MFNVDSHVAFKELPTNSNINEDTLGGFAGKYSFEQRSLEYVSNNS